jgi:hypothetical protein
VRTEATAMQIPTLSPRAKSLALIALLWAAMPAPAEAASVALSGSGAMTASDRYLGTASGASLTTGDVYALDVPGTYTFSGTAPLGAQTIATSSVGAYSFQDSYVFTIGQGANGDVLTASLFLQGGSSPVLDISNLQFRLYQVASSSTAPLAVGLPAGSTVVTAWMGLATPGSATISATFGDIQAGTYILDVAGLPVGSAGGLYGGSVALAPIVTPLPAAFWLLCSGASLLGFAPGRRRVVG